MRIDWDTYFMRLAFAAAERATCTRLKVGGVLVKDKRVLATGYNGARPNEPHCIDDGCLIVDGRCKRTTHMEENVFSFCNRTQRSGATLYSTHSPCSDCVTRVVESGVVEVVYGIQFKSTSFGYFLDQCNYHGIVVRQHGD